MNMISKQFIKSSVIYSVVGSLPVLSGIILIFFFTSRLTPTQFGINAILLALLYIVQIFSSFSLDSYIGISYLEHKDNPERLKRFVGTVLAGLLAIGAVVVAGVSLGGNLLFRAVFEDSAEISFFPFGFLTVVTAVFNGIFKSYSSLLINRQRPVRFLWLNLASFVLTISLSLVLLHLFPFTLWGPVLGRLIPTFLLSLVSLALLYREFGFTPDRRFIRGIVSFCTPMFIYAAMLWVVNYIDRFIITHFLVDPMYAGIFDFAVKVTLLIDILQVGLSNTIHPRIYTLWQDRQLRESTPEVNRYYNGFTALTLLAIPLVVVLMPYLIPLLVKKEIYYQSFAFLAILSIGFATRGGYYLFLAPLYFFKKTKALPRVLFLSALFQIAACTILIRYYGLMGAVWANFLVKPVEVFLLYLESRKVFRFRFNRWKILYSPLIFILYVIATEFLKTDGNRLYIGLSQMALSFVLVWFTYRKELIPMIRDRLGR